MYNIHSHLIVYINPITFLSIPVEVKGKFLQKINETRVSDTNWSKNHIELLKQNYSKAKCYNEVFSFIENLYKKAFQLKRKKLFLYMPLKITGFIT